MKRFIKFIVKCVLLFFLCAGAFFGYSGYKQYKDLTSNKNVAQIVETIEASPDFIPYKQLPKTFVDATVAIEDRRFSIIMALTISGSFEQWLPNSSQGC